ncbi:MAG: HEAT repeat domain-containing protein [Planctomycetota bacterium]
MTALITALVNPDKHERNFVILALATAGAKSREAVSVLVSVLQDPGSADSPEENYRYPRATAAIALGMMGAEASEAVPALVEILTEKGGWEFQRAANCFALGQIGAGDALAALEQALQDSSPTVRTQAAMALQAIVPSDSRSVNGTAMSRENDVAALVRTLTSKPSRINPKVVEGLRALGKFAGAAKPVAKRGSRKTAPPVHESISLAIGYLDSLLRAPSTEEMTAYTQQEQAGTFGAGFRQYVMALGGVQQGIAPVLLEALGQGERDPRVHAVRRMAAIGPAAEGAIPALRTALADADWLVRREAYEALQSIGASVSSPKSP